MIRVLCSLLAAILLASGVPQAMAPSCGIMYSSTSCDDGVILENDCIDLADDGVEIDEYAVEMLACVIYCEAGADYISDETRRMVGDVVLNRVEDPRFPDTIEGVLTQRAQYGRFHWTGIVWPSRATSDAEKNAVDRAYRIARELLTGTHSALYGQGYCYQAEFKQGKDHVYSDGIWFGR